MLFEVINSHLYGMSHRRSEDSDESVELRCDTDKPDIPIVIVWYSTGMYKNENFHWMNNWQYIHLGAEQVIDVETL